MNNLKSLDDWLNHWQNLHKVGIDLGLSRVNEVWGRLNKPRLASNGVITVAGTNGKGSSVKMFALILAEFGYRVGTFTSPHIHKYNERISFYEGDLIYQVNDDALISAFSQIEAARGDITLSYFEASALAAFVRFSQSDLDFVVLEVGLGGRLDAVNIIDADASLITSIGRDHEAYLGNNLNDIAKEKAGIMRANQLTVYASDNMPASICSEATRLRANLVKLGDDYQVNETRLTIDNINFDLPESFSQLGQHQVLNGAGAITLLYYMDYLKTSIAGGTELAQKKITSALAGFSLAGRFEIVSQTPFIVLDVAHNEDAVHSLMRTLAQYPCTGNRIVLLGMLVDKAHSEVLKQIHLPINQWHIATLMGERGFAAKDLAIKLLEIKPDAAINTYENVAEALSAVLAKLTHADQLVILGSFVTVEQARQYLKKF